MSDTTTALQAAPIKFEELPAIMKSAPEVLAQNKKIAVAARKKAQALLDTIEAEGMGPEIDQACEKFLVQLREQDEKAKDRRRPITQIAQAITKEFTSIEATYDPKKPESAYSVIQTERDKFARQEAEKEKARQAEIARKKHIAQEKIDIRGRIEGALREKFEAVLHTCKTKIKGVFDAATLEDFDACQKKIESFPEVYPKDKFMEYVTPVTSLLLPKDEVDAIVADEKERLYQELSEAFTAGIKDVKDQYALQFTARKKELEDIENASKAEKKRLEEAAKKCQEEEAAKMAEEAADRKKAAEEQAQLNRDLAQADASFDAELEIADTEKPAAQVRTGYVINVVNPAGWGQIAAWWFSDPGKKLDLDKFEKKTLGSMKKDAERHCKDKAERIDSPHLEYVEDYKAVAKKRK